MSGPDEHVRRRIAQLVKMFGSSSYNEACTAFEKLIHFAKTENISFTDVAAMIENTPNEQLKFSESDAMTIYNSGIEKGRTERSMHPVSTAFLDENLVPRWAALASFCMNSPARLGLKPSEQGFLAEVPHKLHWLNRNQQGFLLSIFWKLGGLLK